MSKTKPNKEYSKVLIVGFIAKQDKPVCIYQILKGVEKQLKAPLKPATIKKALHELVCYDTIKKEMINKRIDGRFIGSSPHYSIKAVNDGK